MRYGIIGLGAIAREHIRYLKMIGDVRITGLADPVEAQRTTAAELAGDPAPAVFASHGELLSADIADAYLIASPNHTHRDILEDVIAAGKPVLVEKPLCITEADCRHVMERAGDLPVWVAMEYRYMAPVARLIAAVHAGAIGRLRMLSIREHRRPFLPKVGQWNRFARNTGGTMVEKCCHFFDLMRLIAGTEPDRLFAAGGQAVNHLDERHDGQTPDIVDHAFAVVCFGDVQAALDLCMFAEGTPFQEVVVAVGHTGRLEARVPRPAQFLPGEAPPPPAWLLTAPRDGAETRESFHLPADVLAAGAHFGATLTEQQKFVDMVRRNGRPEVTLRDGLAAVAMGAAAERSIRSGQVEQIVV